MEQASDVTQGFHNGSARNILVEGRSIQLSLAPDGGETKSMDSEKLASYTNTDMTISAYCEYEVHGFRDPSEKEPASLLVLQFHLEGTPTKRRFRAFRPKITVHADPRGRERNEPWVTDCIYPGVAMTSFYEISTQKVEDLTKNLTAGIKGPEIAPAELTAAINKMDQESWTDVYHYTVQASLLEENPASRPVSKPGERRKNDQIRWRAWQPERITSGIDVMQVAMVIFRKPGYDLELTIEFDADVDFLYSASQKWDRRFGRKGIKTVCGFQVYEIDKDSTGIEVRKLRQTQVPKGVEPNHLGKLDGESREILEALGWVHVTEKQKPKKYYVGTGNPDLQPSPGEEPKTS